MPESDVTIEASFQSQTADTSSPDTSKQNPFVDVTKDAYYYDAVMWAVENNITTGKTSTTFEPGSACTRAHAVTFLWRAAGSPLPTSSENPFSDVVSSAYYYNAVLWAVENGITNGRTATTFEPNSICNRGQIVTFLYRSAKASATSNNSTFTDVSQEAYYYDAVNWAAVTGVTQGFTPTMFGPGQNCNRGQIVTFLYRHFVK